VYMIWRGTRVELFEGDIWLAVVELLLLNSNHIFAKKIRIFPSPDYLSLHSGYPDTCPPQTIMSL